MKNKLIILLFLLPFLGISQINEDEQSDRKVAKQVAVNQIKDFKSGVLLVRLYNKKNVIAALESQGMEKRANAIKNKQKKLNKEIIESFDEFAFCEVYFFFSDHSQYLIDGDYSKVDLFTIEGISEVTLNGPNYFVADFGVLRDESSKTSNSDGGEKTGRTKVKQYKGTNKSSNKKCMYLRDSGLNRLNRPFPFTVWFHPNPIQKLSYKEVVERMDKKLHEFYAKNK